MSWKRLPLLAVLIAVIGVLIVGPALTASTEASSRVDVLIGFDGSPGASGEAIVRGAGGSIKYTYTIVPAIAASVPEAAIAGLLRNPRVTVIETDGEVHAIDAELDDSWGVKRIGSGTVHDGGNKGTGIKVAVIDSGIDYNHSDLDGNYVGGHDFYNGDGDPMDDNGHGTHTSGTVAAEDNSTGVVGVAPEADLYAYKVLGASGSGSWSNIIAALQRALADEVQVTNNSYGAGSNPGGIVQAAFDTSAASMIHVASAGNSGNPKGKGSNVGWPANYDSVIAVAATDKNDNRASFSSTGDNVELAAPGVSIRSTYLEGGYAFGSGTSMASPHVAGVAVLAIAAGVTNVRGALQETADDLGDAGRDPMYGFGLVDADEAVGAPQPPSNDPPIVSITSPADGDTFASGATIGFAGTASDTEDDDTALTINLSWSSDLVVGPIGNGGSFSSTLSDGVHTITASVTDSGGLSASDSINITVGEPPANTAPSVGITAPTNGATFDSGSSIAFSGAANDAEDDNTTLTSSLSWSSDLDGVIGAGGSFSVTLSDGTHTITASVTDFGGLSASDSISVTVTAPPPPPAGTMSVDGIAWKENKKNLTFIVHVVDNNGADVPGATVSATLCLTGGSCLNFVGNTNSSGNRQFKLVGGAPMGLYTAKVESVTHDTLTWSQETFESTYLRQ